MAWRNQQEIRKNTPKASVIYTYWADQGLPLARGNHHIDLEEGTCFACGIFHTLQRAHIVPVTEGGSNTVDNIHLLCKGCHALSEGNKKYWTWLTYMRAHEWMTTHEWALKILERNGVDLEEEYKKVENSSFEDRIIQMKRLLEENGIKTIDRVV